MKLNGNKFSISTDEWSSLLNTKQFLNITLHSKDDSFKLKIKINFFYLFKKNRVMLWITLLWLENIWINSELILIKISLLLHTKQKHVSVD